VGRAWGLKENKKGGNRTDHGTLLVLKEKTGVRGGIKIAGEARRGDLKSGSGHQTGGMLSPYSCSAMRGGLKEAGERVQQANVLVLT